MDDGTYADLSRLSYEKDFEIKAKEADSLGWDVDTELSTYNATVFKNKSNGKAVIAYRGTNPLNLEDLAVDLDIAFGLRKHKRFQEAEDLYKTVCQKYHNAQVTGHSLGGALALYVNDLYGVPTTVFNPGSSPFFEKKYDEDAGDYSVPRIIRHEDDLVSYGHRKRKGVVTKKRKINIRDPVFDRSLVGILYQQYMAHPLGRVSSFF
jgi:hypothetical protein